MTKTLLVTLALLVILAGGLPAAARADAPATAAQALGSLHDSLSNCGGMPTADLNGLLVAADTSTGQVHNTLLMLEFLSLLNPGVDPQAQVSSSGARAQVTITPQPIKLVMIQDGGQWRLDLQATLAGLPASTRAALASLTLAPAGGTTAPPTAPSTVGTVDDKSFAQLVTQAKGWVLMDFGAEWCGWCKKLAPELDALAPQYAGKVRFLSLDTDHSPDTARAYGITGLPTMILFHDGQAGPKQEGYLPTAELKAWIDAGLAGH